MSAADVLNIERLRADVAHLLEVPAAALSDDKSLLEQGLDSVRLMELVGRWRAIGANVGFAELAEQPTIQHWITLIASRAESHD